MRTVSRGLGAAASILVLGLSFSASADDFMQECMSATPVQSGCGYPLEVQSLQAIPKKLLGAIH